MKLTEIEIQGFKSFNSKFVFKLDSNLIGIVGPNGSGKSNIIDAIRWALGEQSAKHLRGSNMQDVIFSGTVDKKSKNFAEVTLVFTSECGESRSITRKIYRNGDSEYLLDGKKSKLKEISNIYLDLGITKESYSIITQGKVENIISSKPQDRRSIIEEAAGVLKYKNKRKETYLKLEKTTDNINRLKDIFSEIENRNTILEEQNNKALLYKKYKSELKQKDILTRVYDIKSNLLKKEEKEKEKLNYLEEKKKINIDIYNIENDIKLLKQDLIKLDYEFNGIKEQEIEFIKKQEKLQYLVKLNEEKSVNKNRNIDKLNLELCKILEKKEDFNLKILSLEQDIKNIQDKINDINNLLSSEIVYKSDDLEKIESKIENLKEEYFYLVQEETKLQNNLDLLTKVNDNNNDSLNEIKENIKLLEEELYKKNNEFILKKENSEILIDKKNKLKLEISKLKEIFEKINIERESILKKIYDGKTLKNNIENKLDFLEKQQNNYEYYNVGVKEVLLNKNKILGIHSTVGDIIKFDIDYMNALNIALSNTQQNIIVDSSEVANSCIELLKKTNKGRATFLPISNISYRYINESTLNVIKNMSGFINVASNLVRYSSQYKNIINHLLGNIIIVDNLENGNKIAQKISFKNKIVTLDGQVINSGGSITGGTVYNNSSVIKNKADIEELHINKEKINLKLEELSKKLLTLDNKIISINNELNINNENYENNILKIKELDVETHNLDELISNINKNIEKEYFKLDECNIESNNIEEINIVKENILKNSNLLNDIKLKLDEHSNLKIKIKNEIDRNNNYINDKNIELLKLKENIKYKKNILNDYINNINDLNLEGKNLELEINNESKIEYVSEEDLKNIEQEISNINDILENFKEKELYINTNKEKLISEEIKKIDNLKVLNTELQNKNYNIEKININLGKLELKIDENIHYLVNTYNTTYEKEESSLLNYNLEDISSFKNIIKELNIKIENLGNVNLNAVEEYREVNERFNFYNNEIKDLINSKEKLENIIKEIDKEVTDRFLSTLDKISYNFDKIYKKLFNGGTARITLDDNKDILNCGINIEVNPPGKKMQTLSLLSGGEKALTAISLLFAILEINSSPFVILDEVEAALDEDNVIKFAKFLKQYANENQFLVITHRRGTMNYMDKLYGVTMKEKGISYVIPLELSNIIMEEYINE